MSSQDQRIRECMEILKGKPLVKAPIQPTPWPEQGRPDIARFWTESVVNFAMRVFMNEEEEFYKDANDALYELAAYYRTHRIVRDDRDSYYWHLGEEVRLLWHYGKYGDRKKGLLREDTEMELVRMMAEYNHDNCRMAHFEKEKSKTWKIHESENHHMQLDITLWLQAKIMLLYPEIGDIRCAEGYHVSQYLQAGTEYLKMWLCERGQKSMFVECASDVYSCCILKNIYHLYDLAGEDEELRRLAGSLISLYYATAAQEHLSGCRGGGQARIYPSSYESGSNGCDLWHYCMFGIGKAKAPSSNDYTIFDSAYRCPELIARLANDTEKGVYEIYSRPAGRCDEDDHYSKLVYEIEETTPDADGTHLLYSADKDWGGIVRYSYCTPNYILGTLLYHPLPVYNWMAISCQNRTQGVIFASDKHARIQLVPLMPNKRADNRAYNTWHSAQKGNCLVTMPNAAEYAHFGGTPMSLWVSQAGGLSGHLTERGGWIFTYSEDAYAAVYVSGSYEIVKDCMQKTEPILHSTVPGCRIICQSMKDVVIMEVGDAAEYGSFAEFCEKVLANALPVVQDGVLYYRSLQGHDFTFGLGRDDVALIDGKDPAAKIRESYKSPYINGIWGSPEVRFNYGKEEIVWSFALK